MNQYKHLLNYFHNLGCSFDVNDGEEVVACDTVSDAIEVIESVESSVAVMRTKSGDRLGFAMIIPGLNNDEQVADHSDNEAMNKWWLEWEIVYYPD